MLLFTTRANRTMKYIPILILFVATPVLAQDDLAQISGFVNKYCVSCHGAKAQEGDRRFDELSPAAISIDQSETWHEILDRLNLADMPPKDAKLQPTDAQRLEMSKKLTRVLANAKNNLPHKPQTVLRRLNRAEYDAAMRSVLGLESMLDDPTTEFTPDQNVDHFRNVGDTLVLSDVLLTNYLNASRRYLNHAISKSRATPESQTRTFEAPFCRSMPNPDGQDRPGEYQHLRENATYKHGYLWLSKMHRGLPTDGWYEIRIHAEAIDRDHPYRDSIINTSREDPLQLAIVATDTSAGDMYNNNPTDKTLAVMDVADNDPQWYTVTKWFDKGYTPRLAFPNGPAKIKYMRHKLMHQHRDLFPTFIRDRVHVFATMHPDYDKVEGPKLEKKFLAEQDRLKAAGKPYDTFGTAHRMHTDEAWVNFYSEYRGPRLRIHEVQIKGPLAKDSAKQKTVASFFPAKPPTSTEASELITRFATRAFRRPVKAAETEPVLELYQQQLRTRENHTDAIRVAYQSILCSPEFLYHRTQSGPLNQHELASRLAFFLWSAPPDQQLRRLASEGRLQGAVLREQTERLLNDQRNSHMIASFTDAWLQLDKLGTMLPSHSEHPRYYNDRLEEAMRGETRTYIADAINRDLGVSVLVDSDYSFLNASLARLYGVDGVVGSQLRRVALNDRRRGGLLGQASVLTATANGIDTSPVLRGVWVLESLLGTPPSPPPPDIEPLEPDTRGTTTIREQLTAHREVATCAACHSRIDPPGFALESFDEIGQYRKNYLLDGAWRRKGPKVDPSGELPSGETFDDIVQLKQHLMKRLDLVAQNLASKLLVHATGRLDDPADRSDVLKLMQSHAGRKDIGIRTLIHEIVQSEAFAR